MEIQKNGNLEKWKSEKIEIRKRDFLKNEKLEKWKFEKLEIWKNGNLKK